MSTPDDLRVTAAREYLDSVKGHAVPTLPPIALAREVAELRRHLRGVLSAVEDLVPDEMDETKTQVTLWGGLYFAPADALTVMSALSDAADCAEDHEPVSLSLARAARYRDLSERVEADR